MVNFAAKLGPRTTYRFFVQDGRDSQRIVANDVARSDSGFDVDTNAVTIVGADGAESLPLQSKDRVAAEILDRVERLLTVWNKSTTAQDAEVRSS